MYSQLPEPLRGLATPQKSNFPTPWPRLPLVDAAGPLGPFLCPRTSTHHQTLEELGDLGELVAVGSLVAADGPHQHEDSGEEALLQGLVLAWGQAVEQGVQGGTGRAGESVTCGYRALLRGYSRGLD